MELIMADLCFWISIFLAGLSCSPHVTDGLKWKSHDFLYVTGCVGSLVTLPFEFVTEEGEIIDRIRWTHGAENTIASLWVSRSGGFETKGASSDRIKKSTSTNAGLVIEAVSLADTGYYGVTLTLHTERSQGQGQQTSSVFKAWVLLSVTEAPKLSSESLQIQQTTSDSACSLQRSVRLSCGHVSHRGFPPVDVIWKDPVGQLLTSSGFSDGQFHLDLPGRPLPGNYTCRLTCRSPVLECLSRTSPLLDSAWTKVTSPTDHNEECDVKEDGGTLAETRFEPSTTEPIDATTLERLTRNLSMLQQTMASVEDELADLRLWKQQHQQKHEENRKENQKEENYNVTYNSNDNGTETAGSFQARLDELRSLVQQSLERSEGARVALLENRVEHVEQMLSRLDQNVSRVTTNGKRQNTRLRSLQRFVETSDQRLGLEIQVIERQLNASQRQKVIHDQKLVGLTSELTYVHMIMRLTRRELEALNRTFNAGQIAQGILQGQVNDLADSLRYDGNAYSLNASSHLLLRRLFRNVSIVEEVIRRDQDVFTKTIADIRDRLDVIRAQYDVVRQGSSSSGPFEALGNNSTESVLSMLEERLSDLEERVDQHQATLTHQQNPLVSQLRPTFSWTWPTATDKDSVMADFAITPQGRVVIADLHQDSVVILSTASPDADVTMVPLKHGRSVRAVTNMDNGVIAATVDDKFVFILDTTKAESDEGRERWIRTEVQYYGVAFRSDHTLYLSATQDDAADGVARIDLVSTTWTLGGRKGGGAAAAVLVTLLNQTATREVQSPRSLTVHEDDLYVSDWGSGRILRLRLGTGRLEILAGPKAASPSLTFYQPRRVAVDDAGNVYVATGGQVCSDRRSSVFYTRGFCVVVMTPGGSWRRLVAGEKHVYPYGLALTPTGLAVSLVSWRNHPPVRSLLQWYDLVPGQV